MRVLLFALIALIVAVVAGTAGLMVYQAQQKKADPTGDQMPDESTSSEKWLAAARAKAREHRRPDPFELPDRDDKTADAEPLPEPPKVTAKSELKALNKEKTLYLEIPESGEKRILFAAEVCLREGVLEVLVCKKQTKEHEAILRTEIDARFLHAGLLATGAKNGKPVQWVNPKTEEPEYKPASGQTIKVSVHYTKGGKAFTHPAQEWIVDKKTRKPMAHEWVFAGSRFVKNPDRPDDPEYYLANNGEVIAISNFVDSMLDLPVQVSVDADQLHFEAIPKKIPPLGSKVWVILEPVPRKKRHTGLETGATITGGITTPLPVGRRPAGWPAVSARPFSLPPLLSSTAPGTCPPPPARCPAAGASSASRTRSGTVRPASGATPG
jgi:hypothetical protein